jgi:hypothetical protein
MTGRTFRITFDLHNEMKPCNGNSNFYHHRRMKPKKQLDKCDALRLEQNKAVLWRPKPPMAVLNSVEHKRRDRPKVAVNIETWEQEQAEIRRLQRKWAGVARHASGTKRSGGTMSGTNNRHGCSYVVVRKGARY